jgi:hypothetical protein
MPRDLVKQLLDPSIQPIQLIPHHNNINNQINTIISRNQISQWQIQQKPHQNLNPDT